MLERIKKFFTKSHFENQSSNIESSEAKQLPQDEKINLISTQLLSSESILFKSSNSNLSNSFIDVEGNAKLTESFIEVEEPQFNFSGDLLKSFIICDKDEVKECGFLKKKIYENLKGKDSSRAEIINTAMRNIGGVPLKLLTSENHILNGMSFDANTFLDRLQQEGLQKVTITKTNNACSPINIPAFTLEEGNPFIQSLQEMGFIDSTDGNKTFDGIWKSFNIDGKIYIFNEDDYSKFIEGDSPFFLGEFNKNRVSISEPVNFEFRNENRKTVVLNGGVYSRFESGNVAKETAKFISMGFNVVISEDKHKGVAASESENNVMANRNAIGKKLNAEGVANDDIIWKGTCFSSVPAMNAAAKHKGSHVIVDQGYVDSNSVANSAVSNCIENKNSFWKKIPGIKYIAKKAWNCLGFKFNMEESMKEVTGHVVVISNVNDELIDKEQHKKMISGLKKNEKKQSLKVIKIKDKNVRHAGAWFSDQECNKKLEKNLVKSKLTIGKILK